MPRILRMPRRLEARIACLCVSSVVPFIGFFVWLAWTDLTRQLEATEREALAAAKVVAAEVSQVHRMIAHVLMAFSRVSRPDAPLESLCDRTLREMVGPLPFFQAAVADLRGDVKCGLRRVPTGTNVADREYFQRAITKREFATSGFVVGRASAKQTMVAGYPLYQKDAVVRGVVLLSVDLAWLEKVIADIHLPNGATASLADATGNIIAQYPRASGLTRRQISNFIEFVQTVRNAPGVVMPRPGFNITRPVIAGAIVQADSTNPAFVKVVIPGAVVTENALALFRRGIIMTVLIILIAAGVAWWMSRRLIVNPLQHLMAASKRVGIDDLSVRTGYCNDGTELGQLALSFDQMAKRLERSVRALRALSAGNRTLLRPQTEIELLQAMCKVAVDIGGYRTAMVHYALDDDAKTLALKGHAGNYEDCAGQLNLTWNGRSIRRGPPGIAFQTRRFCVVHDAQNDRRTAPWRLRVAQESVASVISFPLIARNEILGTFTLISESSAAFDESEIDLLGEMADDLAFGIITIREANEKNRIQAALDYAATHNEVTGLPNRTEIARRVKTMMDTAHVDVYVAYIARKNEFLDSLGHAATDDILKTLAGRLSDIELPAGTVGHIAFDEFACVLPHRDERDAVVTAISDAFRQPISVSGALIEVQANIGVARYPQHGRDADLLLRRAAVAAREAVQRDRDVFVYETPPEEDQLRRLALVAELRQAVCAHGLQLHYQPKIDLATLKPIGFEALARWRRDSGEHIPPSVFISLAERTGLIREVTSEVVSIALTELAERRATWPPVPIAINLAPRSLYDSEFVSGLLRGTSELELAPGQLELEITESALVQDPQRAMETVAYLRAAGFRVYIDDFGTGYSSMSYLVQLPVSGLKIDQSFIQQMATSEQANAVVESIINMAHRLRLEVVAEGVESADQVDLLRRLGCNTAQGYYFGKPEAFVER